MKKMQGDTEDTKEHTESVQTDSTVVQEHTIDHAVYSTAESEEHTKQKTTRLSKQEKREQKMMRIKEKYKEKRKNKKEKRSKKKRAPADQSTPKHSVCIEILGGKELMTDKEMRSLASQIRNVYGANRVCKHPVHLQITNFAHIRPYMPEEHTQWKNITTQDGSIAERCREHRTVVLSADSDNVLDHIDENTVYVIGGLVDRNRHKNYIQSKYKDICTTAKLPISQTLCSSTVLSTLHVFNILLTYIETQDWNEAIEKHIPKRKQSHTANKA